MEYDEDEDEYYWIVKHFSGDDFSTVKILERAIDVLPGGQGGGALSVDISPDGKKVVAAGWALDSDWSDRFTVKLYDLEAYTSVVIDDFAENWSGVAESVKFSPDGTFIVAVGSTDYEPFNWVVRKYSGPNYSVKQTIESSVSPAGSSVTANALSVAFSNDSSFFVVGGWVSNDDEDGTGGRGTKRWVIKRYSGVNFSDTQIIEDSFVIPNGADGWLSSIDITDDGKTIVAAGETYDSDDEEYWVVKMYTDPDGDNVFTSSIIDQSFGTPNGGAADTYTISITGDGSTILAGGFVWEYPSNYDKWVVKSYTGPGYSQQSIVQEVYEGTGNLSYVNSVVASDQGRWFLAAGRFTSNTGVNFYVKSGTYPVVLE